MLLVFVLSCLGPAPFTFVVFVLSLSCLRFVWSCLGLALVLSPLSVIFVLSWSCLRFVLSYFVFVVLLLCRVVSCCVALVCICVCRLLLLSCPVLCRVVCFVLFCFGRRRGRLASFLVVLGVVLGHFGSSWGAFWPSWGVLGRHSGSLEAS